ncbi:transcriptional coactivator p15/PC4 family protein [Candidatus Woesearchaeota archaeon]|nr:transcriptional coactivator p15/PC4 family protein [Candidatus Woesearchaeota archaeon]
MEEKEIGRIKKTDSTSVVVRINEFQGEAGVDIREYVETTKYTGLTKKGTRIPKSKWKDFKELINKVDF